LKKPKARKLRMIKPASPKKRMSFFSRDDMEDG
jgi:hypothetical protein